MAHGLPARLPRLPHAWCAHVGLHARSAQYEPHAARVHGVHDARLRHALARTDDAELCTWPDDGPAGTYECGGRCRRAFSIEDVASNTNAND